MHLEDTLQALIRFTDVPRLLTALGADPLWEELPVSAVPARGLRVFAAATAAQARGVTWLALDTDEPARSAREVAKRLAAAGRSAGVLAFYPSARRLAIAVSFGPPAALEIALDAPAPVAVACLRRLERGSGSALAYLVHASSALTGEGAGLQFFRQFRRTLDEAIAALPARIPAADRHALALIQLTRVLLLYFVQSKGWLDGRRTFLAESVDRCLGRKRRIERDLLHPLFFGTLNRPPETRSRAAAALGRIPFLNGGLFEPHRLERRWPATLPTPFWRDAFDLLFERFHFTVSEAGDGSRIAPDMLGRVFEGVMDPGARRETGTFYTPSALVNRVVDAALAALASARLGCDDAEAHERISAREPGAIAALRAITVLDPAVGSGAFLLGTLEALTRLREGTMRSRAVLKRQILATSLFGVDRNAMAVRLTELRLWLAVVAEEPDGAGATVAPLPNLDCLIRQGDSLSAPAFGGGIPLDVAKKIGALRRQAVGASGSAKRALTKELARAEIAAANALLGAAEARADRAIRELLAAARAPTLFGERSRVSAAERSRLAALRAERRGARAARRRLANAGELPWFDYPSQYADVFARGGFDVVLGNPPWVRAESLPHRVREHLAERYRWWRGSGRGFAHRPDLAVAFTERAHELAAPDGVVALVLPAKVVTAGYATAARAALAQETHLHVVADLAGDPDAAFDATTYPLVLITSKRAVPPGEQQMVRTALDPARAPCISQAGLGGAPWVLRSRGAAEVAQRLATEWPPLSHRFTAHLGVKTGADAVFLDPTPPIETALLRPALRGRDLKPFAPMPRRRLLWAHDPAGRPLRRLPPLAAAYVKQHEVRLRARADARGVPPWAVFRTAGAVSPHRVVWADLSRTLAAAALFEAGADIIPLNTCYVMVTACASEALSLAAWLNSTPIRALARLTGSPATGGFTRHGSATTGSLPLPAAAIGDRALAELARAAQAGTFDQQSIDTRVAELLGLAPAEREILASIAGADDRR